MVSGGNGGHNESYRLLATSHPLNQCLQTTAPLAVEPNSISSEAVYIGVAANRRLCNSSTQVCESVSL